MIVAAEIVGGGQIFAYLVPLIKSLVRWKSSNLLMKMENAPFSIILVPTRELVVQIEDPLNFTLGEVDIIISTAGILLRVLRQDEHIDIERRLIGSNLQHVVVDDVDTLIDITFCPAVAEIIRRLETDQIDKMLTPSVHRIMPHVPQKFYRVGSQQKFDCCLFIFSLFNSIRDDIDEFIDTVELDLCRSSKEYFIGVVGYVTAVDSSR
ncbi:unnamed protein product [Rotaria sp. Silwood2]|nr:unnamed protein product [Rotaria sp. Silwood2]